MHIVELCDRAGVPVATAEYYQGERLLDVAPDRSGYCPEDVRRLRLVRTLIEVGGLSPSQVRAILADVHAEDVTPHAVFGAIIDALNANGGAADAGPALAEARRLAEDTVRERDWLVKPDNPDWGTLARLLVTLDWLGQSDLSGIVESYAAAAEELAAAEMRVMAMYTDDESRTEAMVLWTVLGGRLFSTLHRMVREHESRLVFDRIGPLAEQDYCGDSSG